MVHVNSLAMATGTDERISTSGGRTSPYKKFAKHEIEYQLLSIRILIVQPKNLS